MYVTDDMIAGMEAKYGTPYVRRFQFDTSEREFKRILASQKHGRNHDVTLYVRKGDRLVVIAKHIYPPGLYRAPSGGLNPGESFERGIAREMAEELGCEVKLERFLLKTEVEFKHGGDVIFWRSFVFLADYVSGEFNYSDHHEIREVAEVRWEEFDKFNQVMRATDMGGLHYRAALHETVVELLTSEGNPPPGP